MNISPQRLIGCVLILLASLGMSLALMRRSRRREAEYAALLSLIRHIRDSIDCFMAPVGSILSSFSSQALEETGFADVMRSDGLTAAAESGLLSVSEETSDLLRDFASELGHGLRDEEMRRCEYFADRMSELADAERSRAESCRRLYLYLPPLGALSLIIVLL